MNASLLERRLLLAGLFALAGGLSACNPDPVPEDGEPAGRLGQVGYRDGYGDDEGTMSSERGSVIFTEFLWSGSVDNDGNHDPSDVFLEIKNEGIRPLNISGWFLLSDGSIQDTWQIPYSDNEIPVGGRIFVAAKDTGCFPTPDYVIPDLRFPGNAPFRITLRDLDERLLEPAGSRDLMPFAGGFDFVRSRSMERVEMMFGGRGTEPHMWHFHVPYDDDEIKEPYGDERGDENRFVINNDLVAEHCREKTLASPGRPNSPDYSGAYSTGSLE